MMLAMEEIEQLRQRVAEVIAQRSHERRFFEIALDLLCTASLDTGCFVHLNPRWGELLGYSDEELRAQPFLGFVHPDDIEPTLEATKNLGKGNDVLTFVNRYRTKAGTYLYIEWMSRVDLEHRLIYAVARDITERRTIEAALRDSEAQAQSLSHALQAQNEQLREQAASLRELATPVIPLAEDVIAVPLIGEIDPVRAKQLMDVLLAGVASTRARVALIDITGARTLDAEGATALLRAAKAVKLLGAEAVLTGIGATTAQMLASVGFDFSGVVIRSTLREGIAFAFDGRASSSGYR